MTDLTIEEKRPHNSTLAIGGVPSPLDIPIAIGIRASISIAIGTPTSCSCKSLAVMVKFLVINIFCIFI